MEDMYVDINEACEGEVVTAEGEKDDNRFHVAKLVSCSQTLFSFLLAVIFKENNGLAVCIDIANNS